MNNLLPQLIVTIILLALKLDGVIQISWLVVFAPIWVNCLTYMIVTIIASIIMRVQKPKFKSYIPQGKRIVWDAKTQTMYGNPDSEVDANETLD